MMPEITDGINAVMDVADDKIAGVKRKITDMTSSDEWKNADLFGKIDIAWDSIIAKPFGNWVSGDGAQLISSGLGTLFSSAAAILPGGEKAGLTSWSSAGILAKGAATVAQKGKSIVETLVSYRRCYWQHHRGSWKRKRCDGLCRQSEFYDSL